MGLVVLHNPKCGKSRGCLAILEEEGFESEVVEYLKEMPDVAFLKEVHKKLGIPVVEMVRFDSAEAKEGGYKASDERGDDEWFQILVENPIMLQRPIAINGDKAVIARPSDRVQEIL